MAGEGISLEKDRDSLRRTVDSLQVHKIRIALGLVSMLKYRTLLEVQLS